MEAGRAAAGGTGSNSKRLFVGKGPGRSWEFSPSPHSNRTLTRRKKRLEARAVSHPQLAPQKAFVRVATADSRRARKCTQHAVRYRSSSLCLCRLTIANPCNYSSKPPTGPAGGGATWGQETGGGGAIHTPRHGDGGVRWGCRGRRTCVTMMLGPGGASGMLSSSAISASTLAASAASMDAICACSSFSLASAISSAAALPQVEST